MKAILCVAALALLTASCEACAVGSLAGVSVIDRDTGEVLPMHYARGEYWVAGRPGARYAVQLRNRLGGRILAVTSVDGVNVISGATAGWDQAGYVLAGGESYQVTGWRKSDSEVAAFTFTALPDSYAARTGRPANVGVIGVAVFRERLPEPPPCCAERDMARAEAGATADELPRAPAPAESRRAEAPALARSLNAPAMKLGTGHGAREGSYVQETQFERLQSEPNEVIRIRYDSLDNLVAMGIVRRPRPPLPAANPFPGSVAQQFVPDPPG
ncbi:MAG: hypothetical protein JSR36_04920 [Proteobacteria bacterium]|nr:hypothetical protein [Pseudomonadota bacterium]